MFKDSSEIFAYIKKNDVKLIDEPSNINPSLKTASSNDSTGTLK